MKHIKVYEDFVNEAVPASDMTTYQVTCRDQDETLKQIIECIMHCGNMGHTFSVIVDPDEKEGLAERKFEWDGDGSDYIKDVVIISAANEKELKRYGNELWNRGGLDERKKLLQKRFGGDFQTEDLVELPWSELPGDIRREILEIKE